jgi:DNA anti-recombination protein RmuC
MNDQELQEFAANLVGKMTRIFEQKIQQKTDEFETRLKEIDARYQNSLDDIVKNIPEIPLPIDLSQFVKTDDIETKLSGLKESLMSEVSAGFEAVNKSISVSGEAATESISKVQKNADDAIKGQASEFDTKLSGLKESVMCSVELINKNIVAVRDDNTSAISQAIKTTDESISLIKGEVDSINSGVESLLLEQSGSVKVMLDEATKSYDRKIDDFESKLNAVAETSEISAQEFKKSIDKITDDVDRFGNFIGHKSAVSLESVFEQINNKISGIDKRFGETIEKEVGAVSSKVDEISTTLTGSIGSSFEKSKLAIDSVEKTLSENISTLSNVVDEASKSVVTIAEAIEKSVDDSINTVNETLSEFSKSDEERQLLLSGLAEQVKKELASIKNGEPGDPGRDALQLDIEPSIDFEKSYPRGIYAMHKGGLWRSHCKTTGERGWECIVDGLADIEVDVGENLRTFSIKLLTASGKVVDKSVKIPTMIYKNIWKPGIYDHGDTVTLGGSTYLSKEDNNDERPGASSKWILSCKEGRKGQDGRPVINRESVYPVKLGDSDA